MALTKEQLTGLHQVVVQRARCPFNIVDRLDGFAVGLAMAIEIVGTLQNLKFDDPAAATAASTKPGKRVRKKPKETSGNEAAEEPGETSVTVGESADVQVSAGVVVAGHEITESTTLPPGTVITSEGVQRPADVPLSTADVAAEEV